MAIPSEQELANMSLPELEAMLSSKQQELSTALEEMNMQPEQEQMKEQPPQEQMDSPAAPPIEMDEFGMGMTPDKVQEATAKLVEAGMLDAASAEITPELIAKMQEIADQIDPGLYELSQPDQLMEFINGINSGTIELTPAVPAGQPADPVLQGGAGDLSGQLAGGLPPAGAGAAPAPII
tara:strand:- start:18655 stop:19194 length:540 start_codon:yes stop_codon:yes gene_type:complete